MFNVCIEPIVLKNLKKEGYNYEFKIGKIIMRTRDNQFSFAIVYKDDTNELLVCTKNECRYTSFVKIEFDNLKKCPILRTSTKHNGAIVYKTILC